jgi:subtilase-type serine protease
MTGKEYKYIKGIFKRKVNMTMTLSIMVMFLVTGALSFAVTAEEFRTDEYYYMGGEYGKTNTPLDAIKAAEAYAQGYTGKGVTLGIVDWYVNLSHREFLNKDNSYIIGKIPEDIDWVTNYHGSHVAGIISASKDGYGMHGVAFNSNFVSGTFLSMNGKTDQENIIEAYKYFNTREDIKIINNSWGEDVFIDELHYDYGRDCQGKKGLLKLIENENNSGTINIFKESIKSYNKLLIFGNGNFGHMTSSLFPLLSYLDKDVKNNIIGVTALNTDVEKNNPVEVTKLKSYSEVIPKA